MPEERGQGNPYVSTCIDTSDTTNYLSHFDVRIMWFHYYPTYHFNFTDLHSQTFILNFYLSGYFISMNSLSFFHFFFLTIKNISLMKRTFFLLQFVFFMCHY